MLEFVTERRAKALPVVIETFNKIQGRKLPSWNADIKLNLYKNPETPTKNQILDGHNPSAQLKHKQEVKKVLDRYLAGELDGDARARIEAEEKIFSEAPVSDYELFEKERLQAGYLVKDPSKINQTISRYEYLLEDASSPLLSNFTGLLDYRDGSDMPSMEELENKGNVNASIDGLMKKHVDQGRRLGELSDQVDKMLSGMSQMNIHIDKLDENIDEEFSYAERFAHKWTDARHEKMGEIVDGEVFSLYE